MTLLHDLRRPLVLLSFLVLVALNCGRNGRGGTRLPAETGLSSAVTATELATTPLTYPSIGYHIATVAVTDQDGRLAEVPVHIWYPTEAATEQHLYETVGPGLRSFSYASELALDAPVSRRSGPHPLILFFHGPFTCGTQSLFLTEHLARHGFIVAAPDFPDDLRICGQWESHDPSLKVLRGLRDIRQSDDGGQLDMLARSYRVPGASLILDELLARNEDPESLVYGSLDEVGIGVVGHSFGGETILGLIGAHPDSSYQDERIQAAVILSGAVFPFEENLGKIRIPVMVMQGDIVDNEDLHGVRRRAVYEEAQGPAFFLMLRGGVHGSFFNGICREGMTVEACAYSEPEARLINDYSTAFFRVFLLGDGGAGEIFREGRPMLKGFEQRGW